VSNDVCNGIMIMLNEEFDSLLGIKITPSITLSDEDGQNGAFHEGLGNFGLARRLCEFHLDRI
jgi:hypothetical protein